MLTKDGCLERRKRFWDEVPDEAEWALIADPRHLNYLANFWVQPLSFSFGERGILLLEREGRATLLADNFAFRSASAEPYVDREQLTYWYDHKHSVINRDYALFEAVKSIAPELTARSGVIESTWLPAGIVPLLESANVLEGVEVGPILRTLRRSKHDDEIVLLRKCMAAGDAGHARAREVIRPGVSELDVYREIQSAAIAEAGRAAIVYGDFRATNAAEPKAGGLPTEYVIKEGDLFIVDYSVMLDGYRSDFTNTYAVGEPTQRQQELFDACVAGLEAGEKAIAVGAKCADIYQTVSKPLEEAGVGPLAHHAGHGLGMGHPEPPILVPESVDELLEGDVVTLEPGVYVEGVGGMRIEHNILVTSDGAERLNGQTISLT
ncbi:M24 family metallopeptidase [Stratiformator vulcanicus]|uniref:Putative peptidase n=1 Tax=Stratiformator vulcanicus TaxID=2527980 RepID=A0A517R293_9PLAN|nr:Xaa-Pro peptidase family protein [Stratiformator vulcanicus]QDT37999.1 putative peptidase [Stratiformator vulcanicus]